MITVFLDSSTLYQGIKPRQKDAYYAAFIVLFAPLTSK